MKLVQVLLAITTLGLAQAVFAQDKAFRDYKNDSVTPEIAKTEKAFQESCGCEVKVSYDDKTIKTADDLRAAIANPISKIPDEVKSYCTNADSKKAICKMKKLVFKIDKENGVEFKNGSVTMISDGTGAPAFGSVTKLLDP